jgi:hypothetical protein
MKKLLEITDFGGIDADNDSILFECFEDHEAFQELLDFKKFLVVGRKGSGKTAIFKKVLSIKEYNFFSFGHTFSDYPWHYHDKQARVGIPDYDKYTHSWKYLILLTLSKIILNQDQSLPYDNDCLESMTKIESFVLDSYGTKDPDITQIFAPAKKLKLNPTFEINWTLFKAGISPENLPMEELPVVIQEVNTNLTKHILNCLNPDHKYYICFDQLDLGFDPQNPEYFNRLIGLLLACRDLNIKAREHEKKLLVSIFLRDDIYDNLHFEDKNKITENYLSRIEWDTKKTKKTLKDLMQKRFYKLLANEVADASWETIFDETKKMTGNQTKYQYLLDRTFLRPRDIIKFCNEVLAQYKMRMMSENSKLELGLEDSVNDKFDNIDINAAKVIYSEYFLNELDDEIHKHIPNYRTYLDIFKSIGSLGFSKEGYLIAFESKKSLFPEIQDPFQILQQLFEFSVIGFYRAGGGGYGGAEYVYKYKDPRALFDENSTRYKVHPGFMDALGLKKYSIEKNEGEE